MKKLFIHLSIFCISILAVLQQPTLATASGPYSFDVEKRAAIVVDLGNFKTEVIQIQDDGKPHPVFEALNSHGKAGFPTPKGRFNIDRVILDPQWQSPWTGKIIDSFSRNSDNPMGAAAITLVGADFALHGTNQPKLVGGKLVSHGCIRHQNRDILKMVYMVVPGTAVYIEQTYEKVLFDMRDFDWLHSPQIQQEGRNSPLKIDAR